ncbi:hypothetical protein K469DRAFT_684107 [Zopfia rhizophila CBS 207.26]|uniref:Uncharacterized protein n=1 Tax=Zopfia rhizophila CBS 207.26 TaxID=1314779 RepID=A0A6A6ECM6_9PEZI|nr:hypothetical protein K469DRAFT_684107 [Zopfia rhizophila CBS 207.26]
MTIFHRGCSHGTSLTSHWHLATLLLADLVEIIDDSELSVESQRLERMATDFVATFRKWNCHALSDLAKCACPRDDATFPSDGEYHSAVNQGAILTEPWTVVLIRAFAKAGGKLLLITYVVLQVNPPYRAVHAVGALNLFGHTRPVLAIEPLPHTRLKNLA